MSEKLTKSKRMCLCDLCGGVIKAGDRIRIVTDDYAPELIYIEHVTCPDIKEGEN